MDAHTYDFNYLFELCFDCSMLHYFDDFNMYYQIQKLQIWSFLLQLMHERRDEIKRFYSKSLQFIVMRGFGHTHQGEEEFFKGMLSRFEEFMQTLCLDPDSPDISSGPRWQVDFSDLESINRAIKIRHRKRSPTFFIANDLNNLLLSNLIYLPQQASLFWSADDVAQLLAVLKLDYGETLRINQIDGFVLLMLVNTSYKYGINLIKYKVSRPSSRNAFY